MKYIALSMTLVQIAIIILMLRGMYLFSVKRKGVFDFMYGISVWGIVPVAVIAIGVWRIL